MHDVHFMDAMALVKNVPEAVKSKQISNICVAGSLDQTSIWHPSIKLDLAKKVLNCIHETMSKYYGQFAADF